MSGDPDVCPCDGCPVDCPEGECCEEYVRWVKRYPPRGGE